MARARGAYQFLHVVFAPFRVIWFHFGRAK